MKIEPVTLQGHVVRLEPLRMEHAAELYEVSRDPAIWTYKSVKQPRSLTEMEHLIASALHSQQAGTCLPFAIVSLQRGCAVGETRYHSFQLQDHGLEIGMTWLTPSVQRTGVMTVFLPQPMRRWKRFCHLVPRARQENKSRESSSTWCLGRGNCTNSL